MIKHRRNPECKKTDWTNPYSEVSSFVDNPVYIEYTWEGGLVKHVVNTWGLSFNRGKSNF